MKSKQEHPKQQPDEAPLTSTVDEKQSNNETDEEFGGPKGPEPTRYGDWERKGRCVDF